MPNQERIYKRKFEEISAAASRCQKLSSLGFVINPKKIESNDIGDIPVVAKSSSNLKLLPLDQAACALDNTVTQNSSAKVIKINSIESVNDQVLEVNNINGAIRIHSLNKENTIIEKSSETTSLQRTHAFPSDISQSLVLNPVQPKLAVYPWRCFGIGDKSQKRRFQSSFFAEFPWIEYSAERDAAYCFCCRYWAKEKSPFADHQGFADWQHATGKKHGFVLHNTAAEHLRCLNEWEQFKRRKKDGGQIDELLDKAAVTLRQQNRSYIKTLAEIIVFCGRQDIGLRGHDESKDSENKGNFLELVEVISRHDDKFSAKLRALSDNATYLSPTVQNDITNCIAGSISDIITEAVEQSGMFSLLVDDTKDISKTEQMSIVLRYLDKSTHVINERFVGFFQPSGLDAQALVICITEALSKHKVTLKNCIAQAYDGAAVMSGDIAGVQKKIQELVPHAIYVHCYAHRVNLILVDICKKESIASDFFNIIQSLYVFMSSTVPHAKFCATQAAMHPGDVIVQLKRIIDTRWTCQFAAIDSIKKKFSAVLFTLQELSTAALAGGADRATMALGLLHQILNFKFVLTLELFHTLFQKTSILAESLQSVSLQLNKAISLVTSVCNHMQESRDKPETWNVIWENSLSICKNHAIAVEYNFSPSDGIRPRRERKISSLLNQFVIDAHVEQHTDIIKTSEQYKTQVFFPILDRMLEELQRRFAPVNDVVYCGIDALSPTSDQFLDHSMLEPFALHYKSIIFDNNSFDVDTNLILLKNEISTAKFLLADKLIKMSPAEKSLLSTVYIYKEIQSYGAFNILSRLIQLSLTLPVTSASCERSFSCLKRLKNYLRSTMGHNRLTSLALISIERDLSQFSSLNTEKIINNFKICSNQTRRMLL